MRTRYNERGDFLATTTMPVSETTPPSPEITIPHLSDWRGYTTELILFDISGTGATGQLRLVSQTGTTLNVLLR